MTHDAVLAELVIWACTVLVLGVFVGWTLLTR